jgi:hypothetical protein
MQEKTTQNLREQTKQLLDGPLKHVRGAALAAALLPLASIVATPASAQVLCPASGGTVAGVCGTVFDDQNQNGIQDVGEPGIEGVTVTGTYPDGTEAFTAFTGPDGTYSIAATDGPYTVSVVIPEGKQTSPPNVGDDNLDSDGVSTGGFSVAFNVLGDGLSYTSFGFFTSAALNPGTGTPGYWKNHPEAWPVPSITVGGVTYSKADAIAWLGKVGKDKTATMFSSLVPAMLNVKIGNDGSCINDTIALADKWMTKYGPVGSGVAASSYAWSVGEPLHQTMDAYNNGLLCAPHRK